MSVKLFVKLPKILFFLFFLFYSCNEVVKNTVEDFLPLDIGKKWCFTDENGDTFKIEVIDSSSGFYTVLWNSDIWYMKKADGKVFIRESVYVWKSGVKHFLGIAEFTYIPIPPIQGFSWNEEISGNSFNFVIKGKVLKYFDEYRVGDSKFNGVYKIWYKWEKSIEDSLSIIEDTIWVARDIGWIRINKKVLIKYE